MLNSCLAQSIIKRGGSTFQVSQLCRKCLKRPESNITVRRLLSSKQASPVVKLGDEVYYGTFEKTLKYVKLFSLINSAVVLSAVPFLMTQNWEKLRKYRATSAFAITSAVAVGVVLPVFLHTMSKKYVTHMFYNWDTKHFTLRYYSLFLRKKHLTFAPEDVSMPLKTGFATHLVKERPFFIAKQYFYNENLYGKFLGF
ncbi:transmembrane protein 70 homolog, mitochondrial-like [Convolutriloba macropyga]|uniref:transmembrane protein 70 homolog, mitochondrial-like n=1 Tax=Convolutriloba macropyga TaxID=536237 RepID=UPI003F5272B6